jgi:xylulokinase
MLEGIAYEMRLNMEILADAGNEIKEFRAIGGGTKSDIWTQLKADVTGKKITVLNITEAGCAGAAMLACAASDERPVDQLASQWVHPGKTCRLV